MVCGVLALDGRAAISQSPIPSDREKTILQIQELITENDLDSARRQAAEASAKFPADAGFDNLLGVINAKSGNYQSAEASFKRAISHAPTFRGAYLNLAHLYLDNSKADQQAKHKALAVYDELLRFDVHDIEANYQAAVILMQEGEYQRSLDHLWRLPVGSRGKAQALAVRCADFTGLHEGTRADQAAALLRSHPDFSEADVQMILPVLESAARPDLTITLITTLAKHNRVSGDALRALGLAYEKAGKLAAARAELEQSFADPSAASTAVLLDLARVAHEQGDYKDSLGYLAHAEDLQPKIASIPYYFGLVCLELNLLAEAQKAFRKALDIEPDNASYNYSMGAVSTFSQDAASAIPYFQKYLKLTPGDPRGKLALGAAYFRAGDLDASFPLLHESASSPATASSAHYYLGRILAEQHRVDAAIQELRSSLASTPDNPDALAELGHCYLMKKEYGVAERSLDRALVLSPAHYQANFDLLSLYTKIGDARREAQSRHFDEIRESNQKESQELMRIIEIRPF